MEFFNNGSGHFFYLFHKERVFPVSYTHLTSHEAIEQLIEKGFDIQTVNLLDSYLDA